MTKKNKIAKLNYIAEIAWNTLANVSEGDWNKQNKEWQKAVKEWRNNYFQFLREE